MASVPARLHPPMPRGLVDSSHHDREIADLLWFPTGGGKTEAYLGLIAFVIFLRRLRNDTRRRRHRADAVHAAAADDPAVRARRPPDRCCERSAAKNRGSASAEISIGLWVGQGGTPNKLADAQDAARSAPERPGRRRRKPRPAARVSLVRHDRSSAWQYEITTEPRLRIRCRDKDCEFSDGLPVYVVDEDIYRASPTLVIATSDKFATMPWNPETAQPVQQGPRRVRRPS